MRAGRQKMHLNDAKCPEGVVVAAGDPFGIDNATTLVNFRGLPSDHSQIERLRACQEAARPDGECVREVLA